jgi:hypothetical protein
LIGQSCQLDISSTSVEDASSRRFGHFDNYTYTKYGKIIL